jgi:hypothetical protein
MTCTGSKLNSTLRGQSGGTTLFNYFAPRGIPGASFFVGAVFIGIGLVLAVQTFARFSVTSSQTLRR